MVALYRWLYKAVYLPQSFTYHRMQDLGSSKSGSIELPRVEPFGAPHAVHGY